MPLAVTALDASVSESPTTGGIMPQLTIVVVVVVAVVVVPVDAVVKFVLAEALEPV
jgi:hypothetical protein